MKIFDGFCVIILISIIWATQTSAKQIQTHVVNYETPSSRKSTVLVSAEFGEDVFVSSLGCDETNLVPPQILPCCNDMLTENCLKIDEQLSLPYPGAQCLDGSGKIADFTVTPSQPFASKYFVMHVNNTLECNGIFASFDSSEGDVSVKVYAVGYPIVQSTRLPSVSLCCGFLANSLQQVWDGRLVFEVTVRAYYQKPRTISVPITFHRAERLPLSLFHNLVEVDTYVAPLLAPVVSASQCNGTVFVNHGFVGQTVTQLCDWTIRPTADPIADWFIRAERDWPALTMPNKIAWMVTLSSYDAALALTDVSFNPTDIPSLQFRFNNVFYAATNTSVNYGSERIGASNLQLPCSYSRFESKYQLMKTRLNLSMPGISFDSARGRDSFEELELRFSAAIAPSLSLDWIGCDDFAETLLRSSGKSQSLWSSDCFAAPGSFEYLNDPCCNVDLLQTQCCAPRVILAEPKGLADSARIEAVRCLAPSCATESANTFGAAYTASVSQLQQTCDWVDQLTSYRQQRDAQNLFQTCFDKLIGKYCSYPFECPQSECLPNPRAGWPEAPFHKTCAIPCTTDSDCLLGSCVTKNGRRYCEQLGIGDPEFLDGASIEGLIVHCIAEGTLKLEPFFQFNILDALNLTAADATIEALEVAWREHINAVTCTNPPYWDSTIYEPEACRLVESCNWFHCDSLLYGWCTDLSPDGASCLDPPFRGPEFCGRCDRGGPVCAEVTQENSCIYAETFGEFGFSFTDFYDVCDQLGGVYDNIGYLCFKNASTEETCLPPRFCGTTVDIQTIRMESATFEPWAGVEGSYCYPVCYSEVLSQPECSTGGWLWHAHPDGNYCELPAISYERCTQHFANQSAQWWAGTTWLPTKYATQADCKPHCEADPTLTTKESCKEGFHCSNPLCVNCDQAQCEASGFCEAAPGCYLPHLTSDGSCIYPESDINNLGLPRGLMLIWKPEGCLLTYPGKIGPVISQYFCESLSTLDFPTHFRSHAQWLALNEAECTSPVRFPPICREGSLPYEPMISSVANAQIWDGVSRKDNVTCEACGGVVSPAYHWISGKWVKNSDRDWLDLRWMARAMVPIYNVSQSFPDRQLFNSLFDAASAKREADIMRYGLYCRFGQRMESLEQLSCLCGDDNALRTSEDCVRVTATSESLGDRIAVDRVCTNLAVSYSHLQFGSIEVGVRWLNMTFCQDTSLTCAQDDFALPGFECMEIQVDLLALSRFQFDTRISLYYQTASTQTEARRFNTIKNSDNVVIGSTIGNGISLTIPQEYAGKWSGSLSVCFALAADLELSGTSDPIASVDIATSSRDLQRLEPLGLYRPINSTSKICYTIHPDNETLILFPVGIIADLHRPYYSTLAQPEAGIMWFAIVAYAIVLTIAAMLFTDHVRNRTWTTATLSFWAFAVIIIFLINRSLYMAFLVSGVLAGREDIIVIFSELPSVLYLTVYSLFVFREAEIYHFSLSKGQKHTVGVLRPSLVGSNVAVYVILIIMIILYFVVPDQPIPQTCAIDSMQRALTAKEGIALAYFIIFAFVSFGLLLGFWIYSTLIYRAWKHGQKFRTNSKMDYAVIGRLVACAAVCSIGLLLRIISLLLPLAGVVLSPAVVVVYLLFSDLIPSIFLIVIFRFHSGLQSRSPTPRSTPHDAHSLQGIFGTTSTGRSIDKLSQVAQYDSSSAAEDH